MLSPLYPPSSQLILKVILSKGGGIIEFLLKLLVTVSAFIGLTFWGTEWNVLLVTVLCLSKAEKDDESEKVTSDCVEYRFVGRVSH